MKLRWDADFIPDIINIGCLDKPTITYDGSERLMDWNYIEPLIPYWIAIIITLWVAAYTWRARRMTGLGVYAFFALSQTAWMAGAIMEITNATLSTKIFWDNLQWLAAIAVSFTWLKFCFDFSRVRLRQPVLFWMVLLAFPALFMGLALTNDAYSLIAENVRIVSVPPYTALYYEWKPMTWLLTALLYGVVGAGMLILYVGVRQLGKVYRGQAATFAVAVAIPTVLTLAGEIFDLTLYGQSDLSVLGFIGGNLAFLWGIARYQLLNVMPLARDMVVENLSDAVIVLDADSRVVDMNALARQALDPTAPDPIGQPVSSVFPAWVEIAAAYQRTPKSRYEHTLMVNGQEVTVDLNITELRDARGRRTAIIIVARDVSEAAALRKQIESNLKELGVAKQRYADLVNNIPGVVFVARSDSEGGFSLDFVSDRSTELSGFTPAEAYANPDLIHANIMPEYVLTYTYAIRQALRTQKPFSLEFAKMVRGEKRWRHLFTSPIQLPDGQRGWQGVEMDVTDRHKVEEALAAEKSAAEQRYVELTVERERRRLMEQIIRGTSHDLRTPISALLALLYVVGKLLDRLMDQVNAGADPAVPAQTVNTIRERVQTLEQTTRRLSRLVELMLDMARLDSGVTFSMSQQDLNEIAYSVVHQFQRDAILNGVTLTFSPTLNLPKISMDSDQITRLVRHLVENALQYTPKGGQIEIRTCMNGDMVTLCVIDTGIGIPAEDLPHIFERFYRGDKARNTVTGGGGLGLSIAARVAEMHSGKITVESEVGKGSTFRVFLPVIARNAN
jgi:PAS domain S-box-containing protein